MGDRTITASRYEELAVLVPRGLEGNVDVLPPGRDHNALSGEAYQFMRQVVGRPIGEPYLGTLRDINKVLEQTWGELKYGRGNVKADLENTQNESYLRRNQERHMISLYLKTSVLRSRLGERELPAGIAAQAAACFSRMAEASNCGGHAATGAYLYLREKPLVSSSPSVVTVRHAQGDHEWFEVHHPPNTGIDTRVVGDSWSGAPAVMSADSHYAATPNNEIVHRWQNEDVAATDAMTLQFSDMKPLIEQKVQEQLANRNAIQVTGTIFNHPKSTISEAFAQEVQAALARAPRNDASPELMREVNRLIAHALDHTAESAIATSHSQPAPLSGSGTAAGYWSETTERAGVKQESQGAQISRPSSRMS